ncbi:MAG: GMC family oxidoreductase, partial [Candidatus Methylomirabilis sp.]|nr:GMC family oxidoreductase [Deltaproteobacteria bacterium]
VLAHLHPFASIAGVFDETVAGWRGVPQSYLCDAFVDFEGDSGGYFLMPGFAWPISTAINTPGFGPEFMELLADFPRMAVLGVMLHDTSEGRVTLARRADRPAIDYRLNAGDAANLRAGLKKSAEIYFAAGARKVVLPFAPLTVLNSREEIALLDRMPIEPHRILVGSVHPQGTLRMGKDPRTSATDAWGEHHDVKRLFVADTSLFPTSLGGPPMITTAALATRLAERLVEKRAAYF